MKVVSAINKSIDHAQKKIQLLIKKSQHMAVLRLVIILAGTITGVLALYFSSNLLSLIAIILFFVAFTIAAKIHHNIKVSLHKFETWKAIKERHLQRRNLQWDALPSAGITLPTGHPYARDVDICGPFSLHRLLDNCFSTRGSRLLLDWLSRFPEELPSLLARQETVKELKALYHFRDKLSLISRHESDSVLDAEILMDWLNKRQRKIPSYILIILVLLSSINLLLGAAYYYFGIPAYFIFSLSAYIGLFFLFMKQVQLLFNETVHLENSLKKIAALLHYLQKFRPSKRPRLSTLLQAVQDANAGPDRFFRMLNRLLVAVGFRQNPVIAVVVNLIFPVDYILMQRLQKYKQQLTDRLPQWLDSLHQLDAVASLANYTWLNPGYTFPNILSETAQFSASGMGHPLIGDRQRVLNDFELNPQQKVALISGSNMSGKSTFLRTIGANLALAYAGSPVCADYFSVSPLRMYSCIRIDDALDQGLSYFYAEVKRLKLILSALEMKDQMPVLFLIDEIFKGTNNRERLIGSKAYILKLLDSKGIGLVSSHDLELTALAEQSAQINNYHFEEQIIDGKMQFDYKIKTGPSPSTNALKIMELEGLPVK